MNVILGTGQLGLAVMEVLCQSRPKEKLLLVNRSGKLSIPLPPNVTLMTADVTNKKNLETIARGAAVIFSCTDMPYQVLGDFYPATAEALAYALSKTSAKLVFADNMYSYGNTSGAEMREELPHQAKTKKGRIRAAVLQTLLYSAEPLRERVAFVKASDFIGPRIHKGVFGTDFLQRLAQGRRIVLFGNPRLPHTFTYINDFARGMVNVGMATDAFGQVWHVPNAPALDLFTWVRLFETETGKKARTLVLPKAIVWMAGLTNPIIGELYELAYQYEHPYRVNHDKYVARFGNHATHPLDIAQETAKWFACQPCSH